MRTLAIFVFSVLFSIQLFSQDAFITTWETTGSNESITIPTEGSGYNYTVDWGDGVTTTGHTSDASHVYAAIGTHVVSITGTFPRIYFNNTGDKAKINSIDQWGDSIWTSMKGAFWGCSNLNIVASDTPVLSQVTNMNTMFAGANSLDANLSGWDVSNVDTMKAMFLGATLFNQDISTWDVSSVVDMSYMFQDAERFNQNIDSWNVSNVTAMNFMFFRADSFNQPINSWNVSQVITMERMFNLATSFNQDLSAWVTTSLSNSSGMFWNATSFNQNIQSWNMSNVTNTSSMFRSASAFNQPLANWDVSSVTDMTSMFSGALLFNQDLSTWAVSEVTTMKEMFWNANNFDQSLGNWTIALVSDMQDMFKNVTLSTANYDAILIGWRAQSVQQNVIFSAGNSKYCDGLYAKGRLSRHSRYWTITDGGQDADCHKHFETTWETVSQNSQVQIRHYASLSNSYNYVIDWGDGEIRHSLGTAGHIYAQPGIYKVKIAGTFPGINFGESFYDSRLKIKSVDNWGDGQWKAVSASFQGCTDLQILAIDTPDLSQVTNMSRMFSGCINLNSNINHWDVSSVTVMQDLFSGAISFNQPLDNWDVSNVTHMPAIFFSAITFNQPLASWDVSSVLDFGFMFWNAHQFNQPIDNWNVSSANKMNLMFAGAHNFNQPINSWNVSKVRAMERMFNDADLFNQPLNNWNVSKVTNMHDMFKGAVQFNQPLNNWNVSNVTNMSQMFRSAFAFDQPLNDWNIEKVNDMNLMFDNTQLSRVNYDSTLIGWHTQLVQQNVQFDAGNSRYCFAGAARSSLINSDGWNITDGGSCEPFVSTWQTTINNESLTIPTTGSGYSFNVDWGDGTVVSGYTTDATHIFTTPGTHTISIRGYFPRIYFNNTGDKDKIIAVDEWGTIEWESMNKAFYGCSNLSGQASDAPDLSMVTNVDSMFFGASAFNQNISDWNTSTITTMRAMFHSATSFDQFIGSWDVQNVTDMSSMFENVTLSTPNYDNILNGWLNLPSLSENVAFSAGNSMYCNAKFARRHLVDSLGWTITDSGETPSCELAFITTWNTGTDKQITIFTNWANVTYNYSVDWGDGTITNGHTVNATHVYDMAGVYVVAITGLFPQLFSKGAPISNLGKLREVNQWGDNQWLSMEQAFFNCPNVQGMAVDTPKLSQVTNMDRMFDRASNFNQDIGNWNVSNVTTAHGMFRDATKFNQDIGAWDVANITDMGNMFYRASNFNQDISSWDVSNVTNMSYMFEHAWDFDQNLGTWNISNVTNMAYMLYFVNLSTTNYDSLLIGWQAQNLKPNVLFHGGNSMYCEGQAARLRMINENGWNITDGGGDDLGTCCPLELYAGSSPISDGIYTASETITADKLIPFTGNVTFKAGNEIFLNAEFEVESGAEFEIILDDCSN